LCSIFRCFSTLTKLPKATYIDGDVLIVANCPGNNYGHWLHQVLPRFHLAEQAGVKFAELSAILINNSTAPFTSQTLDLLGIPKEKRILVGPNQHFKARRLIVPTSPPGGNPPRWVFDYLRKSYLKCTVPSRREKRVYISRKCAPTRRFTNEEEVEEAVKKFGFEIVQLEHLPFARQAELFRECEAVVSTHGSGLTNMAFCEPATKIIEIYAPGFPEICWWNMSCVLDLDYYFLYAEGTRKPYANDIRDNHVNSKCNIPMLVETIKSAGL
jgi:capsular polysaccharide biosynthesis protein